MSSSEVQTTTPQTEAAATAPQALPLNETALIGISVDDAGPRAFLRSRAGRIVVAMPGERTALGDLMAIGENYVVLRAWGRDERLELPAAA
ncbi:hypothetical protein EU803_05710 [Loktanella sp. IMCC34160]|uniref:hypothetical protein n=1 Tax=Rhodobacterales TaxID=204455 RepID=UPI00101B88FB|nr:hypothetical protein [Loktanella sp. IMCC34160]RYG91947.1 hypothetical protein EU803_05710 [Loktanella sp. IMCC34160]